ncbi:uncharacterized protein BO95DRAFT_426060 [Aspergillus brunneoviolaceus CBS 621.78]|uniref:Uncharacterized protein n=1 Tax=Aspergillus brunneoviolaceus CBS 621.78 TaxID=1450534 RepID=A0ACD1FSD4_9EURO|nr:hypothetical protein BO95DRAFT_426060 [Aspergillus brunneoviolaceus CBS 621.78]RAH39810.1 hypothetical protein BO95DRAFT_426060 [Aspergillus brunneoviolaceus CBS 621.78]
MVTSQVSLSDFMQNHRELLVNPLSWTSHHLNLLGCRFEDADNTSIESTGMKDETRATPHTCADLVSNAERVARSPIPNVKHHCLVDILVGEERAFARSHKGPRFSFAGKPVHRSQYTVLHRHGRANEHVLRGAPSMVGYLHHGYVNGDRMRLFEVCPDPRGRINWIGAAIAKKRLAQITPQKWTDDPYISRLLVTGARDHEHIHLYEAEITAELRKALTCPNLATACIERPVIRPRQIAFQPYDTFADRVTAELVAPKAQYLAKGIASSGINGTKRGPEEESSSGSKARRLR